MRMDLSYASAQLEEALRDFPSLAHAVPPAPLAPPVSGAVAHMSAEEAFAAYVAAGAPKPADTDVRELAGPFVSYGNCLSPIFGPGELSWYDPRVPAKHGDFVLVALHPRVLEGIIRRNMHKPEWLAMYGERPGPIVGKILHEFAGEYWLLTNESMFPLGPNRSEEHTS